MEKYQYPVHYFQCSTAISPEKAARQIMLFIDQVKPPPKIAGETGVPGLKLDFNYGLRLQVPEGNWRVVIGNAINGQIYFDEGVSEKVVVSFEKFYIPWQIDVFRDGEKVFSHTFDPEGQPVMFYFPNRAMGDSIALLPYVAAFVRERRCKAYIYIAPYLREIVERYYPELQISTTGTEETYATYYVGMYIDFYCGSPEDCRYSPMEYAGKYILGIQDLQKTKKFYPSAGRKIKERYVCIGAQASWAWKGWHYPHGWDEIIEALKERGYRVLCIDKDKEVEDDGIKVVMPEGAEDFTGELPLSERIELLAYADFFIGLGSGLAWLAYAVGCPVVMICGFSASWYEFFTPYRVYNDMKCHGCYNDARIPYNIIMKCPRHQGTPRAFECSSGATSKQVLQTIVRLIDDLDKK